MKIAVRYFTRTGNTQKLADAIAAAVGAQAQTVGVPLEGDTDILFLGSSVYAAGVDTAVKDFIKTLGGNVKTVVNFSTAALLPSTYKQVAKLLAAQKLRLDAREFHCRGSFSGLHKGRPNAQDLAAAQAFARDIVKNG